MFSDVIGAERELFLLAEEKEWHIGDGRAEDAHIHASMSSDERNSVPCVVLRSKYMVIILFD